MSVRSVIRHDLKKRSTRTLISELLAVGFLFGSLGGLVLYSGSVDLVVRLQGMEALNIMLNCLLFAKLVVRESRLSVIRKEQSTYEAPIRRWKMLFSLLLILPAVLLTLVLRTALSDRRTAHAI